MNHPAAANPEESRPRPVARRSLLAGFLAAIAGGIATLFPLAVGWGVLFDPLRRRRAARLGEGSDGEMPVRIGPLDMLPADGQPRQFAVSVDVADAWSRDRDRRIGSVYLSRSDSADGPQITAFTATCPHLGCSVDYDAEAGRYQCPCHASAFAKDGRRLFGPSRRGLDPLPVQLVDDGGRLEIWVTFERFRTGVAERVPLG